MLELLNTVDDVRLEVSSQIEPTYKNELGQFMTPSSTARFMASLFSNNSSFDTCRLLDPGAGMGALTCAFLERFHHTNQATFKSIQAVSYEIDAAMRYYLDQHLQLYSDIQFKIHAKDFIEHVTSQEKHALYTHVIMNPPYKKIHSQSEHRKALSKVGIETVNLYSAFLALAISLTAPKGEIVAIIPRSFCNGPYYRSFREYLLARCQIRHIHLFSSRNQAFKDDNVLQENIIIKLERSGNTKTPVIITTSTDDTFSDIQSQQYSLETIVHPEDSERFIHIPTSTDKNIVDLSPKVSATISTIGLSVSTGAVVDFRVKEHIRAMPEEGSVPLIYPVHFKDSTLWPRENIKKANAIMRNSATEKWLYPNGYYCVVRRFSSKEEKKRIHAFVVEPERFGNAPVLGFENHLNVFHHGKNGIEKELAFGLAAFLSSTAVDECFRRYNGHTQVNATDLKTMKYPSKDILVQLGIWAMKNQGCSQEQLDAQLFTLLL